MPGNRCSVAVCSNSFYKTKGLEGSSSISYFRFPSDSRLRKIWIEACKRKDDWNPNNAFICSIHFTEDDFERNLMVEMNFARKKRTLKPGRISTLQRWASSIDMRQGLLKDVIHIMKVAALNLKEFEKVAVILFDEMKVEEVYELDKTADEVVGPHKQMQ
ncbi:hypothetical protein J437_LFUL000865, partial [Ladona fulva]